MYSMGVPPTDPPDRRSRNHPVADNPSLWCRARLRWARARTFCPGTEGGIPLEGGPRPCPRPVVSPSASVQRPSRLSASPVPVGLATTKMVDPPPGWMPRVGVRISMASAWFLQRPSQRSPRIRACPRPSRNCPGGGAPARAPTFLESERTNPPWPSPMARGEGLLGLIGAIGVVVAPTKLVPSPCLDAQPSAVAPGTAQGSPPGGRPALGGDGVVVAAAFEFSIDSVCSDRTISSRAPMRCSSGASSAAAGQGGAAPCVIGGGEKVPCSSAWWDCRS